jgi:hypothetical protein
MTETLFPDSELPTAPTLGPEAIRERLEAAITADLKAADFTDAQERAWIYVSAVYHNLPSAGLEISDRGRVADFKACLADWLRLAADNEACGEESVDFEELRARTRRLIGGKS